MTERTLIALARTEAAKARIEAMKIENITRKIRAESPAYIAQHFFEEAYEIDSALNEFFKS